MGKTLTYDKFRSADTAGDFARRFGVSVEVSEDLCERHSDFDWVEAAIELFGPIELNYFLSEANEVWMTTRRSRGSLPEGEQGRVQFMEEMEAARKELARLFARVYIKMREQS